MKYIVIIIAVAGCMPDPTVIGSDTSPDLADAGTDASTLDGGQTLDGDVPMFTLLNSTPRPQPDAQVSEATDAGPDADLADAGPVPTLDTCEPCETDAECLPGLLCAVSNATGMGATRCLPACGGTTEELEGQCGFFGNYNDPPEKNDRAWLCYEHGVCGPLNEYCVGRFFVITRFECVNEDYCEDWLETDPDG